jgi:hypothetical protein
MANNIKSLNAAQQMIAAATDEVIYANGFEPLPESEALIYQEYYKCRRKGNWSPSDLIQLRTIAIITRKIATMEQGFRDDPMVTMNAAGAELMTMYPRAYVLLNDTLAKMLRALGLVTLSHDIRTEHKFAGATVVTLNHLSEQELMMEQVKDHRLTLLASGDN